MQIVATVYKIILHASKCEITFVQGKFIGSWKKWFKTSFSTFFSSFSFLFFLGGKRKRVRNNQLYTFNDRIDFHLLMPYQTVNFSNIAIAIMLLSLLSLLQHCDSKKLLLLIYFLHFLHCFLASFLSCALYTYCSSNYHSFLL